MAFKKAKGQCHRGDEQQNGTESSQSFSADEPVQKAETATVVPEVVEELSEEEVEARHRLELKVERAFEEAGNALKALRDRRLYRSTHHTFEDYCQSRFGFTHRHVNYLIAGSQVFENLEVTSPTPTAKRCGVGFQFHNWTFLSQRTLPSDRHAESSSSVTLHRLTT